MKIKQKYHLLQFPELLIFKYMWLLVIIPKSLQLVFIALVAFAILYKTKRLPKGNNGFIIMIIVQAIAVFWQILISASVPARLMASINTMAIWVFGIYFLSINKKVNRSIEFYGLLTKYIVFNLLVYVVLFILSRVTSISSIHFLGQELFLRRADYMFGSSGTRLIAFMETPLASSHMYLFSIPILSIGCLKNVINKKAAIIIATLALIAIYATHSRIGMLMCAVTYLFFVLIVMRQAGVPKRIQQTFIILFIIVGGLIVALNYKIFLITFLNFFSSRSGSNEARFEVYIRSLKKAWNESPIIGIGIKYMVDNFIPYGSHNTYIGIFYKTGIIGSISFIYGMWKVIHSISFTWKKNSYKQFILCQFFSYLVFLVFADIDGVNWVMIAVMSLWGLLSNVSTVSSSVGVRGLDDETQNI